MRCHETCATSSAAVGRASLLPQCREFDEPVRYTPHPFSTTQQHSVTLLVGVQRELGAPVTLHRITYYVDDRTVRRTYTP